MPYINGVIRSEIVPECPAALDPGELNFQITSLLLKYLGSEPNYQKFNDVMGVLACASQELYRRSISGYEVLKAAENGDLPYPYTIYRPKPTDNFIDIETGDEIKPDGIDNIPQFETKESGEA